MTPVPYHRGPYSGPYDVVIILKLLVIVLIIGFGLEFLVAHPDLFSLLLILFVVLLALALTHVVFTVLRAQYLNRWGPVRTARGVVTRKYTDAHDYGLPIPGGPLGHALADALDEDAVPTLYQSVNFWVVFDLGTGKEEEFRVPELVYTSLEEGLEGVLTYRGEQLLSFVPSGPSTKPPSGQEPPSSWKPGPHLPRS